LGEGQAYNPNGFELSLGKKFLLFGFTFGFTFAHDWAFAINETVIPHYLRKNVFSYTCYRTACDL